MIMLNEGQVLPPVSTIATPVQQTSFFESFKNAIQPEAIAHKLGIDKNTLVDIGMYGAIGFIIGFLLKKYSEYFIAFALFVVGIVVLQQFGYVAVNFNTAKLHEVLGLQSVAMVNDGYGVLVLEWMKSNVPAAASLVIGFLVGLRCA
jgi:uncharacterized membrane protein (Fun14 family)